MKTAFAIIFVMLGFLKAEAASISKVKGNKVLINLEGAALQVGQPLKVANPGGKTVGILKVMNLNKDKALAMLIKGNVSEKDKILLPAPLASTVQIKEPVKKMAEPVRASVPRPPYYGSVLLGLASNTLSIKVGDGATSQDVDNTGNSVGVAVAIDRRYFQPWFKARAVVAYEQFNAIGAAKINGCNNQTSKDCQTDIKYLSGGLYGKYDKEYGRFHVWTGLGLHFKFPFAKSSTALVESSLGTTAAYGLVLGTDYVLETKNFVTASIEKQFFLKSDSAETTTLFVRVGVGKEF